MSGARASWLLELQAQWEADALQAERIGDARGATVIRALLADVLERARTADDEVLDLDQAAQESGYSKERLRKLVAAEEIPNAGRRGAPAVRRQDLPRRPGARSQLVALDAAADARALLG